jgi:hypothetical protein
MRLEALTLRAPTKNTMHFWTLWERMTHSSLHFHREFCSPETRLPITQSKQACVVTWIPYNLYIRTGQCHTQNLGEQSSDIRFILCKYTGCKESSGPPVISPRAAFHAHSYLPYHKQWLCKRNHDDEFFEMQL